MRTSLFFAIMAFSSALTFLRGLMVAAILIPEAFGSYATVIATGAFFGIFISFGSIEATWKQFPTLWAQGRQEDVSSQSRRVDRGVTLRIAGLMLAGILAAASFADLDMVVIVAGVGAFAFATAIVSSGSSFLRASGNLTVLGQGTLIRTIIAVGCAVAGAWLFSWPGAVAGELIGAAFFWLYVEYHRRRAQDHPANQLGDDTDDLPPPDRGGISLYLAGLLNAVPIYLDRFFVREAVGPDAIGTYGFLMLFNMGAATVVGIVAQKVGPQVIRLGVTKAGSTATITYAGRWIVYVAGAILLAMCIVSVLILYGTAVPFAEKYGVTGPLLVALSLLCLTHAFILLDWVLMERGQERVILRNAVILVGLVFLSGAAVVWMGLGILHVVILLVASRALHICLQMIAVMRHRWN